MSDLPTVPKVSIVVPIYEVEKYLKECVDSILSQTLKDIEVILVDDGSKDRCPEIVDEYAVKDSRVVAIHRENKGPSAARNAGMAHARAPYIMFCDGDDFYEPNMCEVMYNTIEDHQVDIAVCGIKVFYEVDGFDQNADESYYAIKYEGEKNILDLPVGSCDVSPCNKIYRLSVIRDHDLKYPEGLKFEDFYFFHALALYIKSVFFIKDKLYNYRRRAGSTMKQTFDGVRAMSIDHYTVTELLWNLYKKEGALEQKKAYIYDVFFDGLHFALRHAVRDDDQKVIVEKASKFVRRNFVIDLCLSEARRREIKLLKKRINPFMRKGKIYLFGKLIRIDVQETKVRCRFLGIPVMKERI
jgi:glycosyltransferase involved in cell wall biosynthesis